MLRKALSYMIGKMVIISRMRTPSPNRRTYVLILKLKTPLILAVWLQQTCTQPLTYGGATVNGCASFSSRLYCWSIQGSWIPCGPGARGSAGLVVDTVTQLKNVQRVSLDNNVCTLPTVIGVRLKRLPRPPTSLFMS